MTTVQTRQLCEALFAVIGIWLLIRQLPDYATSFYVAWANPSATQTQSGLDFLAIRGIHFSVSLAVGITLIFARERLSRWLAPHQDANRIGSTALISVGVAMLGIYKLADGLVIFGTYYVVYHDSGLRAEEPLIRGGLSVAIGVLLFISSVSIARLWSVLRGHAKLG